jgi:hypothetical protein
MLVGAYAASPDLSLEPAYYEGLRALPFITGLEIPFYGKPIGDGLLDPRWNNVLTCIPGVMLELAQNPAFGLASGDEAGRQAALAFTERARQAVHGLNRHFGRAVVRAVEIHSARLSVEHCRVPGHAPAKSFLALGEEIAALRQSQGATPAGILINWGRSAIEGRDAAGPYAHLKLAGDLLDGLMFSGATSADPLYGAWADSHAPFARECPNSLLTEDRAKECLKILPPQSFVGFKMQALPATLTVEERIEFIRRCASSASLAAAGGR